LQKYGFAFKGFQTVKVDFCIEYTVSGGKPLDPSTVTHAFSKTLGQSRPPQGLMFWKIDLEEFIERVNEELDALDKNIKR
jgi:hypothetical protein